MGQNRTIAKQKQRIKELEDTLDAFDYCRKQLCYSGWDYFTLKEEFERRNNEYFKLNKCYLTQRGKTWKWRNWFFISLAFNTAFAIFYIIDLIK